jgi:hypothetical protein
MPLGGLAMVVGRRGTFISAGCRPTPRSLQRPPYDVHTETKCGSEGMPWIDFIGFSAAFTVLASFCMTTIVALRTLALLSNVLFILYGLCAHIYPVLVLHIILLPINLVKLHRIKPNLTHASR